MASINPETAWEFADAIKSVLKLPTTRRRATVQSVDKDGTIWVQLPGSSNVTPIASTGANVAPGDTVLTELRGTSLHITENNSDPAVGTRQAGDIARQAAKPAVDAAKAAQETANEANAVAQATNQHFWDDDNGAHVTDVTQDEWTAAAADDFSDLSDAKPYHNLLMNSLGILLRTALNNLVSITRSAIAFYDGAGNAASNIVARFGSDGAQIGKSSAAHSVIDADGQRFYASDGSTQLANIGYGEGAAQSGTDVAPYYTFGTRAANSTIGNYSVVEGFGNRATAWNAHAEGGGTAAIGWFSHAEGNITSADGDCSHAEGEFNFARGDCAHAEGSRVSASGDYSHAQNYHTKAASEAQTAIGKNNVEDADGIYALIIGNGTADNARSNAFAVEWDGTTVHGTDTHETVINNVLTAASGVSMASATYESWGRIATFYLAAKTRAAKSGTWNFGTLPTGKRPLLEAGCFTGNASHNAWITADGVIHYNGSVASGANVYVKATYLLA